MDPSQSRARKTVSISAARSPGSLGNRLTARFQVGGGDAGGGNRVAGRAEGLEAAQLGFPFAHVLRGQRPVAVEERVVAAVGVDVEGDLIAAGDERAEPDRRLGGKPGQGIVDESVTHAPGFRPRHGAPAPARSLASGNR